MPDDLMELLQGSGVESIMMPRSAFIKEHKKLIGVLRRGKPAELKKEAAEQAAELKHQLVGGPRDKSRGSAPSLEGGRGPSAWISALKEWNGKSPGTWCVPRKGSSAYDEVREIFTRLKGPVVPKVPKGRKTKAVKEAEERAAKEAEERAAKEAEERAAKEAEERAEKAKKERFIAKYMEEWKAIQDFADDFADKKEWNKSTFKDKYVKVIYKSKHPERFEGWSEFAKLRPDIAVEMARTEYPDHVRKYYNEKMAKTAAEKLR